MRFRSGIHCSDIFVKSLGPFLTSGCPDCSGCFPSVVLRVFSFAIACGWKTEMREQQFSNFCSISPFAHEDGSCSLPGLSENSYQTGG